MALALSGSIVLVSETSQDVLKVTGTNFEETDKMQGSSAIPSQRRFVLPKLIHSEQAASQKTSDPPMLGKVQLDASLQDRLDSIHEVYSNF